MKLLAVLVLGVIAAFYGTGAYEQVFPPPSADNSACDPLVQHGDAAMKADILLVGKDYASMDAFRADAAYFMDFDADNRGLFNIEPFRSNAELFNVWLLRADIGDWEQGLVSDARAAFAACPFADYKIVLSRGDMGRAGFAYGGRGEAYLERVHEKRLAGNGASGLPHEMGHLFGLKDEYYSADGRDAPGTPNCADSREQAEQWWGEMADAHPDVGYFQGCSYAPDNWRPHEQSIMGNGGLWSYGPVNARHIEQQLARYN